MLELVCFAVDFEKFEKLGKFSCHFVWGFTSNKGLLSQSHPKHYVFDTWSKPQSDVAMTFPGLKDVPASSVRFSIFG